MNPAIHWFRRDLRVTDNTGLDAARAAGGSLVPVYISSAWRREHRWTGPARQTFLCGCLRALSANIESLGGRMVFRRGDAADELVRLARETGARLVTANADPDPFGRATERRVAERLRALGCELRVFQDAALHAPEAVRKDDGQPYRVFTPYSKAWARLEKPAPRGKPRTLPPAPPGLASNPVPTPTDWGLDAHPGLPEAGERAARQRMRAFLAGPIFRYGERRNLPAGQTTSRLSQDLRHGTLSIRELYRACLDAAGGADAAGRRGVHVFINELVWREFYFQILHHYPEVLEVEFNPKFRGLRWPGRADYFARWCEGRTGFPIVDAAMRQLAATGFMHNRSRMIAAMFLTKDLHLDWRLGEAFFMRQLVDGEIASNNGGWQWSAGTGADAAPYFRIQNPWSQTKAYDPEGAYIKEWVPELRAVDPRRFLDPPPDGKPLAPGYPAPVVDHAREREAALALFAEAG